MVSGIVVIDFVGDRSWADRRTIRVLVRNADNVEEALPRGVRCARVFLEPQQIEWRHVVRDFQRVEFDAIE